MPARSTRRVPDVEHQVGVRQPVRGGRGGRRAPHQCVEPGDELRERERLGQVVIRARLEAHDAVVDRAARRQHDDRRRDSPRAGVADDVDPALARKHDVDDRGVVAARGQVREAIDPGARPVDHVAILRETLPDEVADPFVIFDQRETHHLDHSAISAGIQVCAGARSGTTRSTAARGTQPLRSPSRT